MQRKQGIRLDRASGMVVIPPGSKRSLQNISRWWQWEDRYIEALRDISENQPEVRESVDSTYEAVMVIQVALVPEPTNPVDPEAILVCPVQIGRPNAIGAPIGYVSAFHLSKYAAPLHGLMAQTGGPLICQAIVKLWESYPPYGTDAIILPRSDTEECAWETDDVYLNLPRVSRLRVLVEKFLTTEEKASGTGPWTTPADHNVQDWLAWSKRPHSLGPLHAEPRVIRGEPAMEILTASGINVGLYSDGILTLLDERSRPDAVAALQANGHHVLAFCPSDENAPFARATVRVWNRVLLLCQVKDDIPISDSPIIGLYNRDTRVLTAWTKSYLSPLEHLLRRHGLDVGDKEVDRPPYFVRSHNREAHTVTEAGVRQSPIKLREELRWLLPGVHARWLNASWVEGPFASKSSGESRSERMMVSCELCPREAMLANEDSSSVGFPPLCEVCSEFVSRGRLSDTGIDGAWTKTIVWALRRFGEIHGVTAPSERDVRDLSPLVSLSRRTRQEALLIRMLIPSPNGAGHLPTAVRNPRSWTEWLIFAGLIPNQKRVRGVWSVADDGHMCRSLLERQVDDFFHRYNIAHDIEPHYPHHPVLNTGGLRADWKLADGTYVELLGMLSDVKYERKVERKRLLAAETGTPLLTITPSDLGRLHDIFRRWIRQV